MLLYVLGAQRALARLLVTCWQGSDRTDLLLPVVHNPYNPTQWVVFTTTDTDCPCRASLLLPLLLLSSRCLLPAGFCVELCVAAVIIVASRFGIPMS